MMGYRQLSIFDFLNIALIVIFMITASAIFLYWTWYAIDLCIAKWKSCFKKKKKESLRKDKIEGPFVRPITAITMDSMCDSVSVETSYETADEEEDVEYYI